jgi:hypothetical protein
MPDAILAAGSSISPDAPASISANGSGSSPAVPSAVANLYMIISGSMVPDVSGSYQLAGEINGKNCFTLDGNLPESRNLTYIAWDSGDWKVFILDSGLMERGWSFTSDAPNPANLGTWTQGYGTGTIVISESTHPTSPASPASILAAGSSITPDAPSPIS